MLPTFSWLSAICLLRNVYERIGDDTGKCTEAELCVCLEIVFKSVAFSGMVEGGRKRRVVVISLARDGPSVPK